MIAEKRCLIKVQVLKDVCTEILALKELETVYNGRIIAIGYRLWLTRA